MNEASMRRHDHLLETFRAVDACLASYYVGNVEIYRPLASQLRILLCDVSRRQDSSLLVRCFKDLELPRIAPIEWVPVGDLPNRRDVLGAFRIRGHNAHLLVVAKMPFTVTKYRNGLEIADLDSDPQGATIPLRDWLNQCVTIHTGFLTIRDIVQSVANKGGGAHVDDYPDKHLKNLKRLRPISLGAHILFIIAIARLIQGFGCLYAQFRERVGYDGDLGLFVPDPGHSTITRMATVDPSLAGPPAWCQGLLAVRNTALPS